jgi:hypothetical protein
MADSGSTIRDFRAEAREKAAVGGARAGRGFRYQDAVAAALAVVGYVEGVPWTVSPEADEDVTVRHGAGPVIEFQVRSRRSQMAEVTASDIMRMVADIWSRHIDRLDEEDVRVCLVIDRLPTVCEETGLGRTLADVTIVAASTLDALASVAGREADELRARSHVLLVETPALVATGLLEDHLGVQPIEAEVLFRQVLSRIGDLADQRADGKGPGLLSPNEAARAIEEGQRLVDTDTIEAPLRNGVCEFIDFETPKNDPAFYLGVDVVAGHIPAGLVADRPAEIRRCLDTLERTGTAIITGPSGVGKTAVAYLVAHSTRDVVRWIRVREHGSVFELIKLTEALRATRHAPVGFLVDDIGRVGASMWDSLIERTRDRDGVYVLGTTREEDLDLLVEAPESVVIRPQLDEDLAEAIWTQLSNHGATTAGSWVEALDQSGGLTLEFVHYLTTGDRLLETVARQVKRRRAEHRDSELGLLRIVSLSAGAGASVDLRRFADQFELADEDVQRALARVLDEHLVRSVGPNQVAGLHRLRSAALQAATHAVPPPSLEETAMLALKCSCSADLPTLVADLVAQRLLTVSAAYAALTDRLSADPCPSTLAGCLEGLRLAALSEYAVEARGILDAHEVPLAFRYVAIGLALIRDRGLNDLLEPRLASALPELRNLQAQDLRSAWLGQLPGEVLDQSTLFTSSEDATTVMLALGGLPAADEVAREALERAPSPVGESETAKLIDAARLVSPTVATAAVAAAGGPDHILELARDQAWVISLEVGDEVIGGAGQRVLSFELLCVEGGLNEDAHEAVVGLCRLYFALFPDVQIVRGVAVDASGAPMGFRDFTVANKQIPRSNLPSLAEVRWNRELLNYFADAGNETKTERLSIEAALLERATAATRAAGLRWLAGGRLGSGDRAELQDITEHASQVWKRERTSPDPAAQGAAEPDIGDIASAVKLVCGNALPRLFDSPDRALVAFLGDTVHTALLKTIGVGYWRLLGIDLDGAVLDLAATVDDLRCLLILRISEDAGAPIVWDARAPGQTLAEAALAAGAAHEDRFSRSLRAIETRFRALGLTAVAQRVHTNRKQALIWPPDDVVVLVDVPSLYTWLGAVEPMLLILRNEFEDDTREVVFAPRRSGRVVPALALRRLTTSDGMPFPAVEQMEKFGADNGLEPIVGDTGAAIMRVLHHEAAIEGIRRLEAARPLHDLEADCLARIEKRRGEDVEAISDALQSDGTGLLRELFDLAVSQTDGATSAETAHAVTSGAADKLLGVLTLLLCAEIETALDPEEARSELERLDAAGALEGINKVIAELPGIPVDCFELIAAADGLLARVDECRTIDDLSSVLREAVESGAIPDAVVERVDMWNDLKTSSLAYEKDYKQFVLRHTEKWASAGLPSPPCVEPAGHPRKPGRNTKCPCGSGRKYKQCHGR